MKLFKKVSAMVVSLLMALAMMVPVAAAGSSITITNVKKDEMFNYVKIVKPSTTTTSGWEFVNDEIAGKFISAFLTKGEDAPTANAVLKQITDKNVDKKGFSSNLKTALEAIKNDNSIAKKSIVTDKDGDLTIPNTTKGAYAIFGVDQKGIYTYSPMMVYVESNTSTPTVTSKKETMNPSKKVKDEDVNVEIGKVVEYTITTTVPFNNGKHTQFVAKDTLTGASYSNVTDGKLTVTAKVGDKDEESLTADVEGNTFTLDLTEYTEFAVENKAENEGFNSNSSDKYINKYAGQTLTLKYSVVVTGQEVNNTINMGDGENDTIFGTDEVNSGTTTIIVTKTGEDKEKLNGAGFIVYKEVEGTKQYAQFDNNGVLTGYTSNENEATKIYTEGTDDNGKALGTKTVYGLDSDLDYFFKEVVAPEGYTVPEEAEAVKQVQFKDSREGKLVGLVSFSDTKVGALPETGGIGTTIFTVGGCAIMVVAAALFFMNKKKHEK